MKRSASESQPPLPWRRSKVEIPGWAKREERQSRSKLKQAILTDSGAELFMYLIQETCKWNTKFCSEIPTGKMGLPL